MVVRADAHEYRRDGTRMGTAVGSYRDGTCDDAQVTEKRSDYMGHCLVPLRRDTCGKWPTTPVVTVVGTEWIKYFKDVAVGVHFESRRDGTPALNRIERRSSCSRLQRRTLKEELVIVHGFGSTYEAHQATGPGYYQVPARFSLLEDWVKLLRILGLLTGHSYILQAWTHNNATRR